MNKWNALLGRITLFPVAPLTSPLPAAHALYTQIWREDPDNFQKQANPLSPAIAQGRRGAMMASCLTHPTRIDITLSGVPTPGVDLVLAVIENTTQLHSELNRIINALVNAATTNLISRVALFLQFLSPKSNYAEANQLLTQTLPEKYQVTLSDEEDFVFQVNRPYVSREIQNATLNSITKWNVERLQVLSVSMPAQTRAVPGQASITAPQTLTRDFIVASVSFDNNSRPATTRLAGAQQASLLREALNRVAQTQRDISLNIEGF